MGLTTRVIEDPDEQAEEKDIGHGGKHDGLGNTSFAGLAAVTGMRELGASWAQELSPPCRLLSVAFGWVQVELRSLPNALSLIHSSVRSRVSWLEVWMKLQCWHDVGSNSSGSTA